MTLAKSLCELILAPCAQSSQHLSGLSPWVLWYKPLRMKALCKFASWIASERACSILQVVVSGKTNGNPVNCTAPKCTGFLKAISWIPFWPSTSESVLWCPDKKSKWESCPLPQGPVDRTGARGSSSLAMLSCWCQKTRGAEVRLQGCARRAFLWRSRASQSWQDRQCKGNACQMTRCVSTSYWKGRPRKDWKHKEDLVKTLSSDKPSSNPNWPF